MCVVGMTKNAGKNVTLNCRSITLIVRLVRDTSTIARGRTPNGNRKG